MTDERWHDLGPIESLKAPPLRQVMVGRTKVALSWNGAQFGAIHGVCNHVGGPLGHGTLDGDYVVCPWHHWKFHHATGEGEPGYEADRVPRFELQQRDGHLWIREQAATTRNHLPHDKHALDRELVRAPGPLRVAAISTTVMDPKYPRYSTSEHLLATALEHAREHHGLEVRMLKLRDLQFRHCEGY